MIVYQRPPCRRTCPFTSFFPPFFFPSAQEALQRAQRPSVRWKQEDQDWIPQALADGRDDGSRSIARQQCPDHSVLSEADQRMVGSPDPRRGRATETCQQVAVRPEFQGS